MKHAIIIARPLGKQQKVEAYVRGAFAVHAPDGGPLKKHSAAFFHTVTHIRTGYAVCEVKGRAKALRIARQLNAFLPEGDFTTEDFETDKYKAFVSQAKPVIEEALK